MPGERLVDGEVSYSAAWLDDDAAARLHQHALGSLAEVMEERTPLAAAFARLVARNPWLAAALLDTEETR